MKTMIPQTPEALYEEELKRGVDPEVLADIYGLAILGIDRPVETPEERVLPHELEPMQIVDAMQEEIAIRRVATGSNKKHTSRHKGLNTRKPAYSRAADGLPEDQWMLR